MSTAQTRQALLETAFEMVRDHGVGAVTARALAREAGINQALVYYHFGTLDDLLVEACSAATARLVAGYLPALDAVTSIGDLLAVGERLGRETRANGDVRLVAHLIAAAHVDRRYAAVLEATFPQWYEAVERTTRRLLEVQGLDRAFAPRDVAHLASVAMVGMLLLDGIDGRQPGESLSAAQRVTGRFDVLLGRLPTAVRRRLLR